MDFDLTKEQVFFKENIRRALQEIVSPHAAVIDKEDRFPRKPFEEPGRPGYFGVR